MTRTDFLSNPMTTAEDIIVGGTSGVPERLAAGSEGDVLTIASGAVAWGASAGGSAVPWYIPPLYGLHHGGFFSSDVASRGYFVPIYIPAACTITGIRFRVGTSNGNIDVGLYDESGNRLASSGSTACPSSGLATVSFGTPYAASAGRYFAALSMSGTTATFSCGLGTGGNAVPGNVRHGNSNFPLPDPGSINATESGGSMGELNLAAIVSGGWPS